MGFLLGIRLSYCICRGTLSSPHLTDDSGMRAGTGNSDTIFCILLAPEIAAWLGDSGSSNGKN